MSENMMKLILVLVIVVLLMFVFTGRLEAVPRDVVNDLLTKVGIIKPTFKPTNPELIKPIFEDRITLWQAAASGQNIPVLSGLESVAIPDWRILDTDAKFFVVKQLPLAIYFDHPVSLTPVPLDATTATVAPDIQLRFCDRQIEYTGSAGAGVQALYHRCFYKELPWCKITQQLRATLSFSTAFGTDALQTAYSYYDGDWRPGVGGGRIVSAGYGQYTTTTYDTSTLKNALDLADGEESKWVQLPKPLRNPHGELNFLTGPASLDSPVAGTGDPVTHYQFRKSAGTLQIRFGDSDLLNRDVSSWYDFDEWNDFGPRVLGRASVPCPFELDGRKLVIPNLPAPGWYELTVQPGQNPNMRAPGGIVNGSVMLYARDLKKWVPLNPETRVVRFKYVP